MMLDTARGEAVLTCIERGEPLRTLKLASSTLASTLQVFRQAGVVERRGRTYVLTPTGKTAAEHLIRFNRSLRREA